MARQKGIIKIKGTIGDMTFYKSKDGYMVREKGGVDANKIANDPAFQRTRENGREFGRAGKAGKLLRNALRPLLLNAADAKMVGRLTQRMVKVIQADLVSTRGERNVIDGEAELLFGFDFNVQGKLGTTLFAPFTSTIDRTTGELEVNIPPFNPSNMVAAPSGTTHFKIMSAGTHVDFEAEVYQIETSETAILPLDSTLTALITHTHTVGAGLTKPLFLALGMEFYQEVNGVMYPLKNGSYNPLSIVKVDSGI